MSYEIARSYTSSVDEEVFVADRKKILFKLI